MTVERIQTGTELRAEGRRLSGTVIRFGEVSPGHRERFAPGSLSLGPAVPLNIEHDAERAVAWFPGGGLELREDGEAIRMEVAAVPPIPAGDRALAEVRGGRRTGLSVEFRAFEEHHERGIRVIDRAELRGIGLVRSPSYQGSRVEARARSGLTLRQRIPMDEEIACQCVGVQCKWAEFIGPAMQEAFDEVMANVVRDTLAVRGHYGTPLGSVSAGSVRAVYTGDEAFVHVDVPDGPDGEAVLRDIENTRAVRVRPYLDRNESRGEERVSQTDPVSRVMRYRRIAIRSFVVGATDQTQG